MTTMPTEYINDVNHLYDQEVKPDRKGQLICPACGKKYKTLAGFQKHREERDCASAEAKFKGTITESIAHDVFKETVCDYLPHQKTTLFAFRKSTHYRGVLRVVLFCMTNKVNPVTYLQWVYFGRKPKYYNYALKVAPKDATLRDFRTHLMKNEVLINSEEFFERNRDQILDDDGSFIVRALERADIGIDFCIKNEEIDFVTWSAKLSEGLKTRVIDLMYRLES